jgi:hypothetical protein
VENSSTLLNLEIKVTHPWSRLGEYYIYIIYCLQAVLSVMSQFIRTINRHFFEAINTYANFKRRVKVVSVTLWSLWIYDTSHSEANILVTKRRSSTTKPQKVCAFDNVTRSIEQECPSIPSVIQEGTS